MRGNTRSLLQQRTPLQFLHCNGVLVFFKNLSVKIFYERKLKSELNGNEKYYYMPDSLPAQASRPGTIRTGDLMLYGADCIVLFYKDFRTGYSYTPLGHIDDPNGLESALGQGDVKVTFQFS